MRGKVRKGIILAGGSGTRLHPLTLEVSKQLLPVYDKPMIYFPLSTLMSLGIREVLIIATPEDMPKFASLFGDGSQLGIKLSYASQPEPRGIPEAFLIGETFIGGENVALILGDNIFGGEEQIQAGFENFECGAMIFGYRVSNPSRYGVVEVDADGRALSIVEKPSTPKSDWAVTGFYVYGPKVVEMTRALKPSARGELEISDLNQTWLNEGKLELIRFDDRQVWFDVGTSDSMLNASNFIASRGAEGIRPGCIEETAYRMGFIDHGQLKCLIEKMPHNRYREQLVTVLVETDV